MWRPEANKNICHWVCYKKVFSGLLRTHKHLYEYFFSIQGLFRLLNLCGQVTFFYLRYSILGRQFNLLSRKSFEIQPCFITRWKPCQTENLQKDQLFLYQIQLKSQKDWYLFLCFYSDDVTQKPRINWMSTSVTDVLSISQAHSSVGGMPISFSNASFKSDNSSLK